MEWFDAIAHYPEQVKELEYQTNEPREAAEQMMKSRTGPGVRELTK